MYWDLAGKKVFPQKLQQASFVSTPIILARNANLSPTHQGPLAIWQQLGGGFGRDLFGCLSRHYPSFGHIRWLFLTGNPVLPVLFLSVLDCVEELLKIPETPSITICDVAVARPLSCLLCETRGTSVYEKDCTFSRLFRIQRSDQKLHLRESILGHREGDTEGLHFSSFWSPVSYLLHLQKLLVCSFCRCHLSVSR